MNGLPLPKYSVIDLFAGAGGLSFGFLQTGRFTIKAAFENNLDARKTYQRNHREGVQLYCDVEAALSEQTRISLGKVDVVIGGPPCQGFSNANRQKNHAICQNNILVKKFVQSIIHLNPIAFVMENVETLRSNVHRFYVDESDCEVIRKYGIPVSATELVLLDEAYLFDGAIDLVKDKTQVAQYLWSSDDYLALNIVYKVRKNNFKLKAALNKHRRRLLLLATKLRTTIKKDDYILQYNAKTADAICQYFSEEHTDENANALCVTIERIIMLQRMFSKAMEIYNNNIIVTKLSQDRRLTAHIKSMAILDYIEYILGVNGRGYSLVKGVLSATSFGAPQKRMRFVIIGMKHAKADKISLPVGEIEEKNFRTVRDAIKDLEDIETGVNVADGARGLQIGVLQSDSNISELGRRLRNSSILYNHISTATTPEALERFKAIKQGDNFHSLPLELKSSYSDAKRTQNTIYLRLKYDEPSGTVVNVRKSMWIHPVKNRALSIREAARLQTFPDSFVFCGVKNSQYQQVGNAVPPILAEAIATHLCRYLDSCFPVGRSEYS